MVDFQIYNQDSKEIIPKLGEFADCIVTDPPYRLTSGGSKSSKLGGIFSHVDDGGYGGDGQIVPCDITWKQIMVLCYGALKEGNHAYIMTNNRNMEEALREARLAGFKLHNILVWIKNTKTPNRYYMNRVEYCLFLYKQSSKYINNCSDDNVFFVDNKKGNGHPTEKPVKLMINFIEQSTKVGDLVLDPFMGSGTTGLACFATNRRFLGCEIKKEYFDTANKRLIEYYDKLL